MNKFGMSCAQSGPGYSVLRTPFATRVVSTPGAFWLIPGVLVEHFTEEDVSEGLMW
jgi:hypothetical protein